MMFMRIPRSYGLRKKGSADGSRSDLSCADSP
jgi:hypothetical protein